MAEGRKFIEQLPGRVLRAQMCEAEVLKVFKLLTAEVSDQTGHIFLIQIKLRLLEWILA